MTEPNETPISNVEDREELKRKLAYQFWEEEGRPDNRSEAHWEKACLVVMSLDAKPLSEPEWLQRTLEAQDVPAVATTAAKPMAPQPEEIKSLEAIRKKWTQAA